MNRSATPYKRHRLPPAIIQHAVWLYHRFTLNHRDIEDVLAEPGVEVSDDTGGYANNRAELSHQPTRARECAMRRFKSMVQAQRSVGVHAAVSNLFNLGRHLAAADHYRTPRQGAFTS